MDVSNVSQRQKLKHPFSHPLATRLIWSRMFAVKVRTPKLPSADVEGPPCDGQTQLVQGDDGEFEAQAKLQEHRRPEPRVRRG